MTSTVLVNLHCHSIFSDGELTPEALAELLAANHVRFAALTDHDTLEGQQRFQTAVNKTGIGFISGVELTTFYEGHEVHLLGYGFNLGDAELNHTLVSIRQSKTLENLSIAGSLRKQGNNHSHREQGSARNSAPTGILDTADGIRLIHQAGGAVFLAHPFTLEKDHHNLSFLIRKLKDLGLDGIEAFYPEYSLDEQEMLFECAKDCELLVCAGTDYHNKAHNPAIDFSRVEWVKLRNFLFSKPGFLGGDGSSLNTSSKDQANPTNPAEKHHHFRKRAYILRIFLPTFIAIALFLAAIWVFVLPAFEDTLLDRKREMIRELTNSTMSILTSYYQDEQAGSLSRGEAQALAIDRVETLRYGEEGKDYFWIQDTQPVMIMHPYRPDLNGENLLDFKDARGVRIFVEFANLVQQEGEGYIEYVWQWKDDPDRLEPKESYVKLFAPWEWVIGTGIYIDDVNEEIAKLEQDITRTSVIVSVVIILLLLYVLQQSLQIEKGRQEVLDDLRESTARYHAVVETMTEGTLLVLGNRCQYANATFFNLTGYLENQLPFLDLEDILPRCTENQGIWEQLDKGDGSAFTAGSAVDGTLRHENGRLVDCLLMLNPVEYANQNGFILLARSISPKPDLVGNGGLTKSLRTIDIGIFRARAIRRGVFLEINPAGFQLLPEESKGEGVQPALADLFGDSNEFEQFMEDLRIKKQVKDCLLHSHSGRSDIRIVSLSATLELEDDGQPIVIVGTLRDVSDTQKVMAEREAQISKLQSSLLFFHEPLANFDRSLITCNMHASILQVAKTLTANKLSAALVTSVSGDAVGIITDHDLRERVLTPNGDVNQPAYSIMTSPILRCSESAMIYEAMIKMEENGIRHLAVEDENGQIVNIVDTKMLAQFPRYGAYMLEREIAQTSTLEELIKTQARKTKIVQTLLKSSRNVSYVTKTLSLIHDASVERLIQFAVEEIGPAPSPFVFIAMGSQGRQEPTLFTDQDNGIIYDSAGLGGENVNDYYLELGSRVVDSLNSMGIKYCDGKVMANNPVWCKSLEQWKLDFNRWITTPEPQELLDLAIFFDFRHVFGETRLVQGLREHVSLSLQDRDDFFYLFAQQSQKLVPVSKGIGGLFHGMGGLEAGDKGLNLKDLLMPITAFARLYGIKNSLPQIHTLDRLNELAIRGIIPASTCEELTASYEFIMQLRITNQIRQIEEGGQPDNTFPTNKLSDLQKNRVREALTLISALQKRIAYDFLGGGQ